MRWFRLISPVFFGVALCQIPAFGDGTAVGACNGGKANVDVYLVTGGRTYTKLVKPAECVDLAQADGQMGPATIGFGFTDTKGQYVGAKRFDRVPNWNGPLDAQFGLPVVLKTAHTTLTVKHGAASVTIPGLLAFQAQPQECYQPPPTRSATSQLPINATRAQRAQAAMIDSRYPNSGSEKPICEYPGYSVVVSP